MRNLSTNIVPTASLVDSNLVSSALRCLERNLRHGSVLLNDAREVCAYLQLQLAEEKNEVFATLFLDNQHRLLAYEKLFYGTINETMVYPRVIIQKSLEHNAAAIILAHNHPSGKCEPSRADIEITNQIRTILGIINVSLLDHIIVSYPNTYSFAEHGDLGL
jgi:DNA repair protein RadC